VRKKVERMEEETLETDRLAFISDIHSNLEALESVLSRVRGMAIYCLGDIVGYGASPNEVITLLKERGARSVLGNHDYAAINRDFAYFNPRASIALLWTANKLSGASVDFLSSLPLERRVNLAGLRINLTHGSPDDKLWEYVDPSTHASLFDFYLGRLEGDALALGHTHIPYLWKGERGIVFNPGSVGQPCSGDSRASYALLSVSEGKLNVHHHLVNYDIERSARKVMEAGLPESFGKRLFAGV
jgi:putative phosphoesterase